MKRKGLKKRRVLCIETNERFNSITETAHFLGLSVSAVALNLSGKSDNPVEGLNFRYLD